MTWKKSRMLSMRMFLTNLTGYGVSKVLLLFGSNLSVTWKNVLNAFNSVWCVKDYLEG